jgi:hypothetical protein
VTEERYLELLEAAPPIKRDEITRVSQYQPKPSQLSVHVSLGLVMLRLPELHWS